MVLEITCACGNKQQIGENSDSPTSRCSHCGQELTLSPNSSVAADQRQPGSGSGATTDVKSNRRAVPAHSEWAAAGRSVAQELKPLLKEGGRMVQTFLAWLGPKLLAILDWIWKCTVKVWQWAGPRLARVLRFAIAEVRYLFSAQNARQLKGFAVSLRHEPWPTIRAAAGARRVQGWSTAVLLFLVGTIVISNLMQRGSSELGSGNSHSAVGHGQTTPVADFLDNPVEDYVKEKGLANAIAEYTKVADDKTGQIERIVKAIVNRGQVLALQGNHKEAIAEYSRVIAMKQAPTREICRAFLNRGVSYGQQQKMDLEVNDYTQLTNTQNAPADLVASALVNRGMVYRLQGKLDEALTDSNRVISMKGAEAGEVARAIIHRGTVYGIQRRIDQQVADYTRVVEMKNVPVKHVAKALCLRGAVHQQLGSGQEAIADFTEVTQIGGARPEDLAFALLNRAAVLQQEDKIDGERVLADYAAVISMKEAPRDFVAHALIHRGRIYEVLLQHELAFADYLQVTQMQGVSAELIAEAERHVSERLKVFGRYADSWGQRAVETAIPKAVRSFRDEWILAHEIMSGKPWRGSLEDLIGAAQDKAVPNFDDSMDPNFVDLGEIPQQRRAIQSWGTVHVMGLNFSGAVVTDQQLDGLRRLPHLRRIYFAGANFDRVTKAGMAALSDCAQLELIDLHGLAISDDLLTSVGQCQKLRTLDLHKTRVSNSGMALLRNARSLRWLDISGTKVSEAGFLHLESLTELETLLFKESAIRSWDYLPHLKPLAKLTDYGMIFPVNWGSVTQRDVVMLDKSVVAGWRVRWEYVSQARPAGPPTAGLNSVTFTRMPPVKGRQILEAIQNMTALQEVDLCFADCTNEDLKLLSKLENVKILDLSWSPIDGEGLKQLAPLKSLKFLNLSQTRLKYADLLSLKHVPSLTDVGIDRCVITDEEVQKLEEELKNVRFRYVQLK